MVGTICLQGGREFSGGCRELDTEVLRRTALGPTVILAGAARPGADYVTAGNNAVRYYSRLGAEPAIAAPDPRDDVDGCLEALASATLVVLPGGSPTELLRVLLELDGGRVGDTLRALHDGGATLSGASAGAMVLCARTWRADTDKQLIDGLGLVAGIALPHHEPGREDRVDAPATLALWGLPECGGVLVDDSRVLAAGAGTPVLIQDGETTELSRTHPRPLP